MSLLDTPRDYVDLYPEIVTTDDLGNVVRRPSDTPVTVGGRCQPVSAEESALLGQDVVTTYMFIARNFPAGAFASARWGGRTWDVDGEPARHNGSPTTRHSTVLLRARDPEAVA